MSAALVALVWALAASAGCAILWRDNRALHNRLYAAWKAGAVIPDVPPQEPEPAAATDEPEDWRAEFPGPVADWLAQWEGKEAQDRWARRARVLLAKHKQNVSRVIGELDAPNWG